MLRSPPAFVRGAVPSTAFLAAVSLASPACNGPDAVVEGGAPPAAKTFDASIHEPPRLTSVPTSVLGVDGQPLRVACVTCHSLRDGGGGPPASAAALMQFHTGLVVQHGALSCGSCHAASPSAAPALRLADGTSLALESALELCAQCHGPQTRDYRRGSHGGMTGYWDLSRGPRQRNHCVDCHDPHAPQFQPSRPVLPPRDRGLRGEEHGHE